MATARRQDRTMALYDAQGMSRGIATTSPIGVGSTDEATQRLHGKFERVCV